MSLETGGNEHLAGHPGRMLRYLASLGGGTPNSENEKKLFKILPIGGVRGQRRRGVVKGTYMAHG